VYAAIPLRFWSEQNELCVRSNSIRSSYDGGPGDPVIPAHVPFTTFTFLPTSSCSLTQSPTPAGTTLLTSAEARSTAMTTISQFGSSTLAPHSIGGTSLANANNTQTSTATSQFGTLPPHSTATPDMSTVTIPGTVAGDTDMPTTTVKLSGAATAAQATVIGPVAGGVVGVVFLIIAVALVVYLVCKRGKGTGYVFSIVRF
jgi:hypothetical protein